MAVGNNLAGVQGGRVAQLGPVAHPGIYVDHRHLADQRVLAQGDRAGLDQAGVGSVTEEEASPCG